MSAAAQRRAEELTTFAMVIAAALRDPKYRPTIHDNDAMADAFDRCMAELGKPARAWRGSRRESAS